jgi:tripartite-type tricarboxylate transporter receptor subunit TctC
MNQRLSRKTGVCPRFLIMLLAALSLGAQAQPFPSKPVRFIVPFPPGGPTDIIGRLAAERLTHAWNAQVIVDNRSGGAGNIGMEQCARSPADGYTMCMISIAQSISPAIYPKLGFDPVRDFSHVALLATLPSLLVVHPSVPARNVKELIAYARARPGALNYASGGSGTSSHLLMEMFDLQGGISMVHVAYKGTGPALIDQVSGLIQVAFSTAIAALPYVESGRLRALAVSTKERLPTLPDVPTIDESGLAGFDGGSWQGVVMPAGVARDVVRKVNADLVAMLNAGEMKEKILAMGGITLSNTPEEFSAFVRSETEKWAKVAKAARVKME